MERFYDYDPDNENSFYDNEEDDEYLDPESLFHQLDLEIEQRESQREVMKMAISVCEKKWNWRFMKTSKKMDEIHSVYEWLNLILKTDSEE